MAIKSFQEGQAFFMQKQSVFKQKGWRWAVAAVAVLAVISAAFFTLEGNGTSASAAPATVTVWIQATDSCMEAIPHAAFVINGPGIANKVTAATQGVLPVGVPGYVHGQCPVSHGSCTQSTTGCLTVVLNVPTRGTNTYTITPRIVTDYSNINYLPNDLVVLTPKQYIGQGAFSRNYSYVKCEGGSDCPKGGQVATVRVNSNGSVSATTQNINPDGFKDPVWGTFNGAQNNPVLFHFFGASAPNDYSMVCNQAIKAGDTVKKDPQEMHMTGNPNWAHCRSGR
jgi:hypothetical protein